MPLKGEDSDGAGRDLRIEEEGNFSSRTLKTNVWSVGKRAYIE